MSAHEHEARYLGANALNSATRSYSTPIIAFLSCHRPLLLNPFLPLISESLAISILPELLFYSRYCRGNPSVVNKCHLSTRCAYVGLIVFQFTFVSSSLWIDRSDNYPLPQANCIIKVQKTRHSFSCFTYRTLILIIIIEAAPSTTAILHLYNYTSTRTLIELFVSKSGLQ